MEVKIINYLKGNKGYGITISEIGGNEKVLKKMCYKHNENLNKIEILGKNEFLEMDKYIIYLSDINDIDEDITNMTIFTKDGEIIIENWD
ncbi:TPA: hypothetical protein PTV74_003279 [Clostridium botulinum]|nr:hypothetical protein [Clostridium botulinum]HDK7206433.1 hypothetical protein [Clostridium botulinum]HDK7210169.1 hypothetical protein [Clostridium botulinum]HDK7265618.1 hypothetical protein [Clostridium botulinum]HDK7269466.1 hypothetical protein [Clostridium botulinum]